MTEPDDDWTEDHARAYIAANQWVYARTVPEAPHEYLLAERSTDPEGHRAMIAWIARVGEPETYQGYRYRYAHLEGHVYWTSRPPRWANRPDRPAGLIINRRRARRPPRPGPTSDQPGRLSAAADKPLRDKRFSAEEAGQGVQVPAPRRLEPRSQRETVTGSTPRRSATSSWVSPAA